MHFVLISPHCDIFTNPTLSCLFEKLERKIIESFSLKSKVWFPQNTKMKSEKFQTIMAHKENEMHTSKVDFPKTKKPIVKFGKINNDLLDGTWNDIIPGRSIMMDIHLKGLYFIGSQKELNFFGLSSCLISCLVFEQEVFHRFGITLPKRFITTKTGSECDNTTDAEDDYIADI